jgi:hypothetical protein
MGNVEKTEAMDAIMMATHIPHNIRLEGVMSLLFDFKILENAMMAKNSDIPDAMGYTIASAIC